VLAIVLAILTGQDNVYTVPEFTRGAVGRSWLHAGAHLVIVGAIVLPFSVGCWARWCSSSRSKSRHGLPEDRVAVRARARP
jgi:hypothetical protein